MSLLKKILEKRKTASEEEEKEFLKDFSNQFNDYINVELKNYKNKKSHYSSESLNYNKHKYKYGDYEFKVQLKIENSVDILSKIKKKCDEIKKLPSSQQVDRLIEICNNESKSSFDVVLNIKQVESLKKKGYFKTMIMEVEKICEEQNINLLISQIMNDDFANMLEKNGYYIIRDGSADVNAIKIFQTVEKTLKRKRDEEDEAESEAKRKKKFEEENKCAICIETLISDKVMRRLGCCHGFHKDCIQNLSKNECPLCKTIFDIDDTDNENIKVKTSTNPLDFIQFIPPKPKPNSSKKSDGKSKRKSKRKKSKRKSIRKSIRKYKRKFIRKSIKKSKRKSKNFA
jgi:hypothetical protein